MRKRKTCECCRAKLQSDEDHWCKLCRAEAEAGYDQALAEFEKLNTQGLSAEEAAGLMIDRLVSSGRLNPEPERKTLYPLNEREPIKRYAMSDEGNMVDIVHQARDGSADAKLALMELIVDHIDHHDQMPRLLAAYNIELLFELARKDGLIETPLSDLLDRIKQIDAA